MLGGQQRDEALGRGGTRLDGGVALAYVCGSGSATAQLHPRPHHSHSAARLAKRAICGIRSSRAAGLGAPRQV